MTLPFLKTKVKNEYFFSLVLREDKIEFYIFEKIEDAIRVINSQEEELENGIDNTKFEEILEISDKLITQGEDETKLPVEVSKTIFGVKDSWIEESKIKPDNLAILKKLCEGLGLKPIGFMTVPEGVVSVLQKEEGAPPSAVIAEIGSKNVTVSLVKAGKILESRKSEIHQSPAFTVDTLLKHFEKIEILPSRVVLLSEDEELVQEFIGHQWSKSLPFLHLPQITNLPQGFMGKALALGIAKQTGAQVVDFIKETPIEKAPEEPRQFEENIEYVGDAKEFFGFTDKDIAKVEEPKPKETLPTGGEEEVTNEIPEEVKEEVSGKSLLPGGVLLVLSKASDILKKLFAKTKSLNIKKPNVERFPIKNKLLVFALIPAVLITFSLLYYFLGLRASIVLSLDPRIVEKSEDITFSQNSDFTNNILKGDPVSVDEDGSTTTPATGQKETGNKAGGTVTIFNSSSQTISLPGGTRLTSSNGLNFLTLGDVTIASQSADIPPVSGSNTVNVQAEKFGTEYNLPSGTKFPSITGNADLGAKNDNPFSGGTKTDIVVVSKDDMQKARGELTKQLEDKAKSDLLAKLPKGEKVLDTFVSEGLTKENFDKDLDSEAKNLTLKGTVSFDTIAYDESDLLNFVKNLFEDTTVDEKNLEISFENVNEKGNVVSATLKVKAKIYPKLDLQSLSKKVAGKSFDEARRLLSLPQVSDIKIKFSPNLFFLPKKLPNIFQNIKISLQNG